MYTNQMCIVVIGCGTFETKADFSYAVLYSSNKFSILYFVALHMCSSFCYQLLYVIFQC